MEKFRNLIFFVVILNLFSLLSAKAQIQSEGLLIIKNRDETPVYFAIRETRDKIWFKDSCVIYERNMFYDISEQITTDSFATTHTYDVAKYTYLDLKTLKCQDYYNLSDTALPFCNYQLKKDEFIVWKFYGEKKDDDSTYNFTNLPDTVIDNISYKRTKVIGNTLESVDQVFYLHRNLSKNIFHLSKALEKKYPEYEVCRIDMVDNNRGFMRSFQIEMSKEKLSTDEENIFKRWQQNAIVTKLELLSLDDANKIQVFPKSASDEEVIERMNKRMEQMEKKN